MTSNAFDPYYKWLGIPPSEQPPDHYRLLGLARFESAPDVISNAADQRMIYLRSFQSGEHADDAARLLNEISVARRMLLSPAKEMAVAPPPTDRLDPLDVILAEVVQESNSRPLPRTRPPTIPKPPPPLAITEERTFGWIILAACITFYLDMMIQNQ